MPSADNVFTLLLIIVVLLFLFNYFCTPPPPLYSLCKLTIWLNSVWLTSLCGSLALGCVLSCTGQLISVQDLTHLVVSLWCLELLYVSLCKIITLVSSAGKLLSVNGCQVSSTETVPPLLMSQLINHSRVCSLMRLLPQYNRDVSGLVCNSIT